MSVLTHRYLFYTLAYSPILLYLLCCSNCSSLGDQKLFVLSLVSFWLHHWVLVQCILTFWHCKKRQAYPACFYNSSRIIHWSKEPRFLLLEKIRNQYVGTHKLLAPKVSLLPALSARRAKYSPVYMYIFINISVCNHSYIWRWTLVHPSGSNSNPVPHRSCESFVLACL